MIIILWIIKIKKISIWHLTIQFSYAIVKIYTGFNSLKTDKFRERRLLMPNAANCRNFVIAGHSGSGKTTLCEQILFTAGAIQRVGSVDAKNTVSDFMAEEQEKQSSIYAAAMNCKWQDCSLYFVDTPGYGEFVGQVVGAIRAADAALVVIDAIDGPQVGTARAWKVSKQRKIPRFGFVNRLDKDRADFKATLEVMRKNHGKNVIIPLFWPVGKESGFSGVVNVLFDKDIPADIAADVAECRGLWLDAIAETDEALMERYLEGGDLNDDEIRKGLRASIISGSTIPVFAGSSAKGIGIKELMNSIIELFPTPLEYIPLPGGPEKIVEDGDAYGVVFKSVNDQFSGQLAFIRTVTGKFKADSDVFNITSGHKERLGQLLSMNGKTQTLTTEAGPGTIFAVAKLKDTKIGDTIAANSNCKSLPGIVFPGATMSYAVTAAKNGDDEKIAAGLQKIADCDPTVRLSRQEETHEFLLSGMGDQHLGIVAKRLKEQYKVEAILSTPKVPYRETITAAGEGHYRHKKQTGGAGQFAEVYLKIAYNESGYEFANEVVGGAIPKNFIPAIEKGIQEVMTSGPLVGCTMERIRVAVYDGKYHPVDSNEMAFKIAGRMAFKEAIANARPVLLEPIMKVDISIPDSYTGDITGDLNHKRGRVLGMSVDEGLEVIHAEVPMAEMFRYATELRSITQGRGSFEMTFDRYEQVPPNVASEIIAKYQAEAEKE